MIVRDDSPFEYDSEDWKILAPRWRMLLTCSICDTRIIVIYDRYGEAIGSILDERERDFKLEHCLCNGDEVDIITGRVVQSNDGQESQRATEDHEPSV